MRYPDLNLEIIEMRSSGDIVMARWRATGTRRGDVKGIAPTGKRVEVTPGSTSTPSVMAR